MNNYYDDNYGHYNMDGESPEEVAEFYNWTQKNSVRKECKCCGRMVFLRRDYAICNNCADAQERGYGF